jgi:formylglycine-generating enzyme required for sulfatase activity
MLRTMFAEIPLPLDWPVYATHEQASAFAAWRGASLPTEAQYHRAAFGTPSGEEREYAWGSREPAPSNGNFDFLRWDPVPVTRFPDGDSAFGVSQLCGNGWEWTSTVFAPFPGFRSAPYYPNYSEPSFDG